MHLFYTPDISLPEYVLSEEESRHCISVLRLKIGDFVSLIDGIGNLHKASIIENHPKKCKVRIAETVSEFGKRNYYLHIAIAPTKNIERLEWFLEKATEIGIDEITPLICEHSERRNINPERLIKIITAAVKQSISAYHPILNPMIKYNDFLLNVSSANKYITHCAPGEKHYLNKIYKVGSKSLILVGPEGDFSEKEINFAMQQGFQEITLGKSRLRTETAGIVCCHTIQMLNQTDEI